MLRNPLLVPDLRDLIQAGETEALQEFFEDPHPAQIAEMIEDLEPAEGDVLLKLLAPRVRGDVISYLPVERQVAVVSGMPPVDAAALLHSMPRGPSSIGTENRLKPSERLDDRGRPNSRVMKGHFAL